MEMLENIKILSEAVGTSGDEGEVRELIYNEVKDIPNCEIKKDNAGNLIVHKTGKACGKNRLMFSAHMDEVGFIITDIDEKGFLKFAAMGSIDPRVSVGKRVLVGKNKMPGLLGSKAIHLVSKDEFEKLADFDDLYIDIGADSKAEAEKPVSLGERAVFESEFAEFGEGLIMGRALDDRAGCALLMELLKAEAEFDFYAAFTTREEIGGNGASAAAFGIDPDIAVVVEATTAGDIANVPGDKYVCEQGKGPVVTFMDKGTLYDMELYHAVMDLAAEHEIPAQTKRGICGGNDAAPIHKTRAGIRPVAVSLPARYIHSPAATVKISDLEHSLELLKLLSGRFCEV